MSDRPVHDHRPPNQPATERTEAAGPEAMASKPAAPLRFWRSLGELTEGRKAPRWEVPQRLASAADLMSRQQFLKLMGASIALAGLTACAHEGDHGIAPYVRRPEGIVLGDSQYYATALTLGGYANGLLVRSYAGRPVKVEGNPTHPSSLGGTTIFDQAATMTFYDPDRSKEVISGGIVQTFDDFASALSSAVGLHKQKQGDGMRILTETVTSPTLADQIAALIKAYPSAKWHQWEPINLDNVREGARQAFGQDVEAVYRVDQADVIVTLDADLFGPSYPGSIRYSRDWAAKRTVSSASSTQNRMYAFEPTPSITGSVADHRVPILPSDVDALARAIAAGAGVGGLSGTTVPTGIPIALVNAAIKDLTSHRGTSLVVAGEGQPPAIHVLAHRINQALGNVGKTVVYTDPVVASPASQLASIQSLVTDINGGRVDLLVILGGNPAYDAPADLGFANALKKVGTSFHVGLYRDETANLATWHAPLAHELESWGDARAYDGTTTIIQPLIEPLYGGHTVAEIVSIMVNGTLINGHDLVKGYWQSKQPSGNFEQAWAGWLNDGVIPNTAAPTKTVAPTATAPPAPPPAPPSGLQLVFRPDPTVYDGRFANNSLLQELPKPLTKTDWDNVALISPNTAAALGIGGPANYQTTGYTSGFAHEIITLSYQGGQIRAPALIMPGQAENTVTIHLGYGRTAAGSVGNDRGYNGYLLRTTKAPWSDGGLQVATTGEVYLVADTQVQENMTDPLGNARDMVLAGTLTDFQKNPKLIQDLRPTIAGTLYPPYGYGPPKNRWGMSINLSTCIGCGACEAACYQENNIPIVGKDQVMASRIMHWIRIDRYFEGPAEAPAAYAMPVPCQQCENAPCELVCPVQATTHSAEGLNDMVYNRCVGTRYCSNNCPYKVRRFNFFKFADWETPSLKLMRNPDVSVRERGVMEKCTYCVQRIRHAEIHAQVEGNRPIKDGEVVTACAAACPTQAIVFGDLNDPNAQVTKLKGLPTRYDLLEELNTQPRTSYLGAIRNPAPDITAT